MIEAIILSVDSYNDAAKSMLYRYSFGNVDKFGMQSDEIRFKGLQSSKGKIIDFKVDNNSNDYEISIRSKANLIVPNIDEIIIVIEIDKYHQESGLDLFFMNNDGVNEYSLYGMLKNNSEDLNTNTTIVEFVIERM